jgi:hypothetical protein
LPCHLTGVHVERASACVLDVTVAKQALADLRRRVVQLEELVEKLSRQDTLERTHRSGRPIRIRHRRIVSADAAARLSLTWPGVPLFVPFEIWLQRQQKHPATPPRDR